MISTLHVPFCHCCLYGSESLLKASGGGRMVRIMDVGETISRLVMVKGVNLGGSKTPFFPRLFGELMYIATVPVVHNRMLRSAGRRRFRVVCEWEDLEEPEPSGFEFGLVFRRTAGSELDAFLLFPSTTL